MSYLSDDMESTKVDRPNDRRGMMGLFRCVLVQRLFLRLRCPTVSARSRTQIRLDNSLDINSLSILLELGLGQQCGDAEPNFRARAVANEQKQLADRATETNLGLQHIQDRMSTLNEAFPIWLVKQAADIYP